MQENSFTYQATDGLDLWVYHWAPENDETPRAIVQIVHGLAEHAARYRPVAEALVAQGYVVYAADHRGHGKSIRTQEDLGYFADHDGWNQAVRDLRGLSKHLRSLHEGLPLVVIAHSMGSFMTQQWMIEGGEELDAVVLSGSNGKAGLLLKGGEMAARVERRRMGRHGRSNALHLLSFGAYNKPFKPARTEMDWLSRDPAEVDKYIADPLCGFVATTQFWVDFLRGLQEIEKPARQARVPSSLPVYIFGGDRDPVGQQSKGLQKLIKAYKAAGLTRVEHKFYKEGRHEMFNETNRAEVLDDLIQWLQQALPTRA